MGVSRKIFGLGLTIVLLCAIALGADFEWNWRNQEVIGRNDSSVGNTSKLKEADRTALIDAIIMRLQKPMSESGYDDDRIREIASTSRVHFVDLGKDAKLVVFVTSLGIEGGCDGLGNCPFWIFRKDADGYVSLLDTVAASYTLQPGDAGELSDIVMMRHVSAKESSLALFHYNDGKYGNAGCYTAIWPAPQDQDKEQNSLIPTADPEISPCKTDDAK